MSEMEGALVTAAISIRMTVTVVPQNDLGATLGYHRGSESMALRESAARSAAANQLGAGEHCGGRGWRAGLRLNSSSRQLSKISHALSSANASTVGYRAASAKSFRNAMRSG